MNKSESLTKLAGALAKFQGEVDNPKNTATNPQFRSKYAPLDVVINTVKPVLAKYGLSFSQSTGSEGENIIITTMLLHESGEWIETDPLVLPAYQTKSGGAKEFNAQGAGSGISYGRRYSLAAALGISSEDDDDGNIASQSPAQTNSKSPAKQPPKSDPKPEPIPDTLKELYQSYTGSIDGLEKWVTEQQGKGRSYMDMGNMLQTALDKKSEGAKNNAQ